MKRKLKLDRETITELGARELSRVVGGDLITQTAGCPGAPTVDPCTTLRTHHSCGSGSLTTTGRSLI
jgi:hypothetical protein